MVLATVAVEAGRLLSFCPPRSRGLKRSSVPDRGLIFSETNAFMEVQLMYSRRNVLVVDGWVLNPCSDGQRTRAQPPSQLIEYTTRAEDTLRPMKE